MFKKNAIAFYLRLSSSLNRSFHKVWKIEKRLIDETNKIEFVFFFDTKKKNLKKFKDFGSLAKLSYLKLIKNNFIAEIIYEVISAIIISIILSDSKIELYSCSQNSSYFNIFFASENSFGKFGNYLKNFRNF